MAHGDKKCKNLECQHLNTKDELCSKYTTLIREHKYPNRVGDLWKCDDEKGRFMSLVRVDEKDCWLWEGTTTGVYKYPYLCGFSEVFAHRIAWKLFKGRIPERGILKSKCKVKMCVNPNHYFCIIKESD